MANPMPAVAAPGAPAPAPGGVPVPGAPAPAPAVPGAEVPLPVDGAAAPVDDGSSDQALLAQQMSARFSVVKRTEAEEAEGSPATGGQTPQAAAPAVTPAAAAAPQATVPPTGG